MITNYEKLAKIKARHAKYAEEQVSRLIEAAERAGFQIIWPENG